jgi:hypothetical protein
VHLVGWDYTFGLGSDVYKDPISVGADDDTFNYFAAPELRVSGSFCIKEGRHGILIRGDGSSAKIFR